MEIVGLRNTDGNHCTSVTYETEPRKIESFLKESGEYACVWKTKVRTDLLFLRESADAIISENDDVIDDIFVDIERPA